MIERRFMKGAEVRAKSGDKPGIEGYGAVFNEEYVLYEDTGWRFVETIKPGAFSRVLKENQDVRCLFNHDPDNLLGRTTNKTLRLVQDDQGLSYANDLDVRTTVGANVKAFVERGDLTGCSFAFTVRKQVWRDETSADGKMTTSTREIEEIEQLFDVGPVTYPAYEGTSVSPRSQSQLAQMRSNILVIARDAGADLPAAVRSRIESAGKKKDDAAAECECRCVACARDGKCEKCADHMVDCGDETNCRCMDNRSTRDQVGAGLDCQCDCPECLVGDCEHCTEPGCEDKNCDHTGGDDDGDRTALLADVDARLRRAGMKPASTA
jgi:HK97 family phage prohead protease